MSVSLEYYKIFYYVARYKSITAAAKALFLSQPTVSHYIRGLEEALGFALFVRNKNGFSSPRRQSCFSPTPNGPARKSGRLRSFWKTPNP